MVSSQLNAEDRIVPVPPAGQRYGVEIKDLRKHFKDPSTGNPVYAVDDVTLNIEYGTFCVLLGPSGCGKTTLLRCIAGLEHPSSGQISVDGQRVFDGGLAGATATAGAINLEPQDRPIGMVFQNYALWPHMDVFGNVAFPLQSGPRKERKSKADIAKRVAHVLEVMGIAHLGKRRIGQLSGGQQQRVALARAVAAGNEVVLFDEPLSNIDAKVREQLRQELRSMQRELQFTAVYVTHDQSEAMEMADTVAVMREGKVAQLGSPRDIYFTPNSTYVAQFIGATNIIPITGGAADRGSVGTAIGRVTAVRGAELAGADPTAVVVSKAQHWSIAPAGDPVDAPNTWAGTVESISFGGTHTEYVVAVGEQRIRVWGVDSVSTNPGDAVVVSLPVAHAAVVGDDPH